MALNFDARMAPRNHAELKKLVQAVREASKADETFWLEWKSDLDLNPADRADKSGRAHVARAIIGFANRMPDAAARFVEGYGLLLAGVSHESMKGVTQHDITELVRWIEPYVGEEVRWQPTYVEVEGDSGPVSILVIAIDPPRWGDPIFCMRKEAPSPSRDKSIPEATIFVRRIAGTTDRARAVDLDALSERLLRRVPTLDLEVVLLQGSAVPVTSSEADIEKMLHYLEEQALKPLREHEERSGSIYNTSMMSFIESRSPQRYRQEVSRYLEKCRIVLPEAVDETAAAILNPVVMRLRNRTDTPLLSVQVVLHIHGDVRALENEEGDQIRLEYFERALPELHRFGDGPQYAFQAGNYPALRSALAGPSIRIDNSGPVTIYLPPVELRPRQHVDLEPFVLVAGETAVEDISVEWIATATNMDGLLSGQFVLNCDEPRSFLSLLAADPRPDRDR
ncbi:hypothetical protein HD597_000142 [Nonomuraea thailandensis]|uniref:Uncharacterized protein n=1 Tax=Nonomuraea thailandensis TaxID=1188745 RepID=A0A9X2JXI5_9ACTN|nr:hypothetical protein [Nonomuraea thailandensis]MCP2353122.1 hypothetical protein [Nonomuraea thailandensis]